MNSIDKIPKSLRGKYVSRAAFAKMQGEKNRLQRDIHTLVMGQMHEVILLKEKYRKQYQFWEDIVSELKIIAKKELPESKHKLK